MNPKNILKTSLLLGALFATGIKIFAQDSTRPELLVNISYCMDNNKAVYLVVNTKTKLGKKFKPVPHLAVVLYLDSIAQNNLVTRVITDPDGRAKAILPPALKNAWDASSTHTFIGVAERSKDFEETQGETKITKSKISIDTLTEGETRSMIVKVLALKEGEWLPAKDVEMKAGISRMGGILPAGDEPTYTTDSTGSVTIELKKNNLPGDEKGNIILAAKVEDNDEYGNLLVEKQVLWGIPTSPDDSFFNQRTLWSTRFRTPFWLLFMAYSIVIGVWGTLFYLIGRLVKIKKLGVAADLAGKTQHGTS